MTNPLNAFIAEFMFMTLWCVVFGCQCFRGTCTLHFQGQYKVK